MLREIEIVAYSVNTSNVLLQEDVRIKKKNGGHLNYCAVHTFAMQTLPQPLLLTHI